MKLQARCPQTGQGTLCDDVFSYVIKTTSSHTSIIFGHSLSTSYPVRPTGPRRYAPGAGWPCRVPVKGMSHAPQYFGICPIEPLSDCQASPFLKLSDAFAANCFVPTSLLSGASQHRRPYARTNGGSCILNATLTGKSNASGAGTVKPPCPFWSCVLCPDNFATCLSFRLSSSQRLSLFASRTLTREITEPDSVVSSASENLFTSYAFAPRHLQM